MINNSKSAALAFIIACAPDFCKKGEIMNKYTEQAIAAHDSAVNDLKAYCLANTAFEVDIHTEDYPLKFILTPREDAAQESLFETDAYGLVGEIVVIYSCGGTRVDFGLKCRLQTAVLKKLLNKCAACGETYLHAFKARAEAAYEYE